MERIDGKLIVPEAERRLCWFINSLYMEQVRYLYCNTSSLPTYLTNILSHLLVCLFLPSQLPRVDSVLRMPSLTVVTPHYSEAVIYSRKDFLTVPNKHGITPMVYLKAMHSAEWNNFCQRMNVETEEEAWKATKNAREEAVSGEMEVRLWASLRGQTLARTVRGMMQYARAIRMLAMLQLELEYSAAEDKKPPGETRLTQEKIEEDAALAALWFTAERFSYICSCQRFYEHGEEDIKRRSEIEYLLLTHPLLSVAYFETSPSLYTGKKRLMSVLRNGHSGIRFRIPLPGNPILDGIGEGKPENQMNAIPYLMGRIIQTIDSTF